MLPLHSCALIMLLCFVNCPVFTPRASLLWTGALSRSSSCFAVGNPVHSHGSFTRSCSSVASSYTGTLSRCQRGTHSLVSFKFFVNSSHRYTLTVPYSSSSYTGTLSRCLRIDPVHSHGFFFFKSLTRLSIQSTASSLPRDALTGSSFLSIRYTLTDPWHSSSIGTKPIPS